MSKLVTREKKVAFMGCTKELTTTFHRMKHFTSMSRSSNPNEYSRKYVDEKGENTDVTGYSPSIAYGFDQYTEDPVHEEIIGITDGEKVGDDAIRTIINVDFTRKGKKDGNFVGIKREYAIIPDSDGDDENTYTYSGNFKSKSDMEEVEVSSKDEWQTCEIVTSVEEP
ncbi:hypothetical protein [Amedibacillus dolichus]|jgi:hypothetical protein|uniref:Phage tail protein n=2 Tax=Amedibacillus dolichus TaxID=31971 RepID=A0A942ZW00_9FIRM|nr:hypothetical protein [Amedibacillus dolichus]EDP11298.1 hypothetical protein EUBDOL_01218 [Amedibacillus dolichus DSM 3991]MBS4883256.1 hypothetical protein [Amedibacillus dolichus]